ncbi:chaperone modulator CbpM [Haliea sp. E17]|uniref:chaperone modulator CbpM n=1 Tax=Haliea sp. E17 TaxID=3401576 RepID=UPI003AACA2BA
MSVSSVKISVNELCSAQGVSRSLLVEMVEYDVVQPVAGHSDRDWEFDCTAAHWVKRALRLKADLELDWVAVAMLVDLLREREELARENELLRLRLERFLAGE